MKLLQICFLNINKVLAQTFVCPKLILPMPGSNPTDSNLFRSGSSYASPLGRVAMGVGLDFDDERKKLLEKRCAKLVVR